jgi:hypothetical protein
MPGLEKQARSWRDVAVGPPIASEPVPRHHPYPGSDHDLLGIPVRAAPDDAWERAADRVAADVEGVSDPVLSADRVPSSGSRGVEPPIVGETVASPGRPLDPATRAFFEPRLGHDLGEVRTHTDIASGSAAEAVNAKAFTVGNDIIFGAGRYIPASGAGRRLLAHELAHVVQQATDRVIAVQRSPDKPDQAADRRDQRIRDFARWPSRAHMAWRTLNMVDRNLVVLQMAATYDVHFARDFLREATAGKPRGVVGSYYGPGVGPLSKELVVRGFRLAQKDSVHEWWVNAAGREVVRNFTGGQPTKAPAQPTPQARSPAPKQRIEGVDDYPEQLDPDGDRAAFGPVVATRDDADMSIGKGTAVRYEDGSIELFVEGTTESIVLRPLPGGGYVFYGPDGQRVENVILTLRDQDIPAPDTDTAE